MKPYLMSSRDAPASAARKRIKTGEVIDKHSQPTMNGSNGTTSKHGHSTSLQSIEVIPRSPKSRGQYSAVSDDDEVEMSLLGHHEATEEATHVDEPKDKPIKPLSRKDKNAMVLLIILCEPI